EDREAELRLVWCCCCKQASSRAVTPPPCQDELHFHCGRYRLHLCSPVKLFVRFLTLQQGQYTSGRRSHPVPQLNCRGGSAGCQDQPSVVQCYNRGTDGRDVQWECKAEMKRSQKFGLLRVTCEGYDHPQDEYVLVGSCG
ncbi:hypothetical protein MTO96_047232, partial [Rhipicephalus appendiculatus]